MLAVKNNSLYVYVRCYIGLAGIDGKLINLPKICFFQDSL